jgi:hypothetical protein
VLRVEHGETVVKLFYETRDEAEEAAADIVGEGLSAEVEPPSGGNHWSVTVTGPDEHVDRLTERLLRMMETDE